MKVLLINGSPHPKGSTFKGLYQMEEIFKENGIETEIVNVPASTEGCLACGYCHKNNKCVKDDLVNKVAEKLDEVDALVVGSPVYYAGISGSLKSFLDRLFYSASNKLKLKAAAAITVSRRAGNLPSFDQINKYFLINNMFVVGSGYWNEFHAAKPEEVSLDLEGIDTLKQLSINMIYIMKAMDIAKENGLDKPDIMPKNYTNFIR